MKTDKVKLAPGSYSKGTNTRTLLRVIDGKCVYGHGVPETGPWPVTSCSVRTFVKSVGAIPVRELTPDEAIRLAERMEPYSTKRRSNRWERAMFHTNEGRLAILAALDPAPADQAVTGNAPALAAGIPVQAVARPGLKERLRGLFRKIVGVLTFWRRNKRACATVSDEAEDRQAPPVVQSDVVAVKS